MEIFLYLSLSLPFLYYPVGPITSFLLLDDKRRMVSARYASGSALLIPGLKGEWRIGDSQTRHGAALDL